MRAARDPSIFISPVRPPPPVPVNFARRYLLGLAVALNSGKRCLRRATLRRARHGRSNENERGEAFLR